MKKVIKGLCLMAITTLFMACSSGPKKAMEEYGKDLCKGNYEGYIDGIASKKPLINISFILILLFNIFFYFFYFSYN